IASTFCAAPAIAAATSPSLRATTPDFSDAVASCCTMSAVERFAFGPSSQRMSSAARPCFAAHVSAPTTATASSSRTTCCTPGMAFALASSTLATLPPNTGQMATAANFMPEPHVDAELRRAVDLLRRVEPLHGRADQLEVLGVLEGHAARHRKERGAVDESTVRQTAAGRSVHHHAVRGTTRAGLDLPGLGRGGHEHGAGGGAGAA